MGTIVNRRVRKNPRSHSGHGVPNNSNIERQHMSSETQRLEEMASRNHLH
jgi:hypothetical protein